MIDGLTPSPHGSTCLPSVYSLTLRDTSHLSRADKAMRERFPDSSVRVLILAHGSVIPPGPSSALLCRMAGRRYTGQPLSGPCPFAHSRHSRTREQRTQYSHVKGGLASLEKAQSAQSWIGCGKLYEPRLDNPLLPPWGSVVGEQTSFLGQKPGLQAAIARRTRPHEDGD